VLCSDLVYVSYLSKLVDLPFGLLGLGFSTSFLLSQLVMLLAAARSPASFPPPCCCYSAVVFVGMPNVVDTVVRHLYVPDLKARWGIHVKLLAPRRP
jgi:hypothetical protein